MSTKLVNNALLVFNLNFFFFTTSIFANLIPNSQLSSQDILHHIQQQQQLQQSQQQYQQQLYSPQIHHIDNHKTNIKNHFANNHVEKEDFSSKLLTPSSSSSSSQSLPSTFLSSSPSSSSLSSSILTSIVNGQLPLDEQDTLKLLQHLKSSSLEDFHQLQSLTSSTSTINPPTTSATTTTTTTATPSIHAAQTLQSLSSSPTSPSLTPSSSSFNSFIASIFPTLWAANNNNFYTPFNYPSHKTDENLKTKMLPPIYIQPIVIPYPLIMNPIQNFISDYTSRFMSGYSSDSTLPPSSATTAQPTMSSFLDEYDAADQMARSNTRRSGINSYSNSPIYYVRIPSPTPYTFIPTMSYTTNPVQSTTTTTSHPTRSTFNSNPYHNPFTIQINPPQPIQTFATYSSPSLSSPTLSPILNLPISFISNGKPNGIYQLTTSDSSNTVSSPTSSLDDVNGNNGLQLTYYHPQRIPSHHYSQSFGTAHQTGTSSSTNPFYRPSIIRPHSHSSYQHLNNGLGGNFNGVSDSKITNLKRQYFFNGRPEEIYLLSQSSPASNQYQFQNSIYPTFQNAQNDYY